MEKPFSDIMSKIQNQFSDGILETYQNHGQEVLVIAPKILRDLAEALKKIHGFDMLLDVVAIDWQNQKPKRFEVDYLLYDSQNKKRIILKVPLANNENPEIDSVTSIYASADWAEREAFDMMGIVFNGHPNLKRLLMWENFMGHPLRKDYPLNRRQPIPIQEDIV